MDKIWEAGRKPNHQQYKVREDCENKGGRKRLGQGEDAPHRDPLVDKDAGGHDCGTDVAGSLPREEVEEEVMGRAGRGNIHPCHTTGYTNAVGAMTEEEES